MVVTYFLLFLSIRLIVTYDDSKDTHIPGALSAAASTQRREAGEFAHL
jgi:hypothetical protein